MALHCPRSRARAGRPWASRSIVPPLLQRAWATARPCACVCRPPEDRRGSASCVLPTCQLDSKCQTLLAGPQPPSRSFPVCCMRSVAPAGLWVRTALSPATLLAMQLRQRKLAGSCSPGKQGSTPANATTPAKAPRRGLLPAAGPAAGGTTVPPGATAPEAQPPVPAAGTTAADLPAGAAAQDAALVVPTPEATGGQSSAAKRKRGRLPPVDIGQHGFAF